MVWRLAMILAFLLASPAWAQKLSLPAEVKGAVGAFVQVPADTDCPEVRWYPVDAGLNLFPVHLLRDTRTAVVTSPHSGRYRLLAYTATKDGKLSEPVVCLVVIGDAPPPGPGPTPPTPPGPVDPLAKALLAEYESDADPRKAEYRDALAGIYRDVAEVVKDLKTLDAVQSYLRAKVKAKLSPGKLSGVREVIAKELRAKLGTDPAAPFDPARVSALFARLGTLVSELQ